MQLIVDKRSEQNREDTHTHQGADEEYSVSLAVGGMQKKTVLRHRLTHNVKDRSADEDVRKGTWGC